MEGFDLFWHGDSFYFRDFLPFFIPTSMPLEFFYHMGMNAALNFHHEILNFPI